jgi:hypothetical protein
MARPTRWLAALALLAMAIACRRDASAPTDPDNAASRAAAGARLVGEVALADQADAGGVQVYLPGTRLFAIADETGGFAIDDVPVGVHKVAARLAGYEPTVLEEALELRDADMGQDVRLEPIVLSPRKRASASLEDEQGFGSIEGRVIVAGREAMDAEAQGTPAVVELEGTPYRTTCLSDGTFLLWNLPPDQYRVTARVPGAIPQTKAVRVLPGSRATLQLTLAADESARDGRIAGQVELYDTQGQLTNEFDRIVVRLMGTAISTTLQPDGTFVLENLPRRRYVITAGGDGFLLAGPAEVDLGLQPEASVLLTLTASEPTPSETGRVIGFAIKGDMEPDEQSGISIVLAGTQAAATTDQLGQFTLERVPPGSYRLLASATGYRSAEAGPVEVVAGQDTELEGIFLEPDRDAPRVVQTDPADGSREVMIRREIPVTIRFSRKMVPESLREAVSVDPPVAFSIFTGTEIPGGDFDLLRLVLHGAEEEPAARFRTRYTVTIDSRARDFEGVAMEEPHRFSFTTGEPSVIATLPEDGGAKPGVGPRNPIAIYFNARMDHSTLTPDVLRIRPSLTMEPQLSVYDDPATGWTRMHVSATWEPDTSYSVTVQRRARTDSKNSLNNTPYTFKFRTAKMVPYFGGAPPNTRPSP